MNQHLPSRLDDVPESLLDVAETFGLGVALRMMQHFGGQELEFPRRFHARRDPCRGMVELLGDDLGQKVCHFLAGMRMYVPNGKVRRLRPEIEALQTSGRDRREIARLLGVSQRHVRRLANKPPDKLTLFPDL
ncbi:hypothetical protein [Paenirhodobacter populi]|uniref:Mor transcription activator domain-containing protein n=1 Tax=Paenirhodobacter populi TaxID=2306993 RepID=A0A443J105_9RHOB|nr:hypothetical protein [Sinirhodobacter populi]RWR14238.1 hypothetical protein D2T33_03200 [Sinirhodobacter populi]